MFTRSNNTTEHKRKVSLDFFMRMVWSMSLTNLHYLDFKEEFGEALKRMFKPVRVKELQP